MRQHRPTGIVAISDEPILDVDIQKTNDVCAPHCAKKRQSCHKNCNSGATAIIAAELNERKRGTLVPASKLSLQHRDALQLPCLANAPTFQGMMTQLLRQIALPVDQTRIGHGVCKHTRCKPQVPKPTPNNRQFARGRFEARQRSRNYALQPVGPTTLLGLGEQVKSADCS